MFKITTPTGKYKVKLRASYAKVRSQKRLTALIQQGIDHYREIGQTRYADRLQELLDGKEFHRIAEHWGLFTYSKKIEE